MCPPTVPHLIRLVLLAPLRRHCRIPVRDQFLLLAYLVAIRPEIVEAVGGENLDA